jgi:hypothetical protein
MPDGVQDWPIGKVVNAAQAVAAATHPYVQALVVVTHEPAAHVPALAVPEEQVGVPQDPVG